MVPRIVRSVNVRVILLIVNNVFNTGRTRCQPMNGRPLFVAINGCINIQFLLRLRTPIQVPLFDQ